MCAFHQLGLDPITHGTSVETIDLAPPHTVGGPFGDHPCGAQFVEVITTVDGTVLVSVVTQLHDNREARMEPLRLPHTVAGLLAQALARAVTGSAASTDQSRELPVPEHSALRDLPEGASGGSQ